VQRPPLPALRPQVCKFVLAEEGVSKQELQARATALKLMGERGRGARRGCVLACARVHINVRCWLQERCSEFGCGCRNELGNTA
jgi:hypothetical protein